MQRPAPGGQNNTQWGRDNTNTPKRIRSVFHFICDPSLTRLRVKPDTYLSHCKHTTQWQKTNPIRLVFLFIYFNISFSTQWVTWHEWAFHMTLAELFQTVQTKTKAHLRRCNMNQHLDRKYWSVKQWFVCTGATGSRSRFNHRHTDSWTALEKTKSSTLQPETIGGVGSGGKNICHCKHFSAVHLFYI